MNHKQIEELKSIFTNIVRQGKVINIPSFGIGGKVVGVGFKPYWTEMYDSKVDKMELNIQSKNGRILSFSFNYIVGYDKVEEEIEIKKTYLDLYVYSVMKVRDKEPFDKIRIELDE